jgi:hypothetical protein
MRSLSCDKLEMSLGSDCASAMPDHAFFNPELVVKARHNTICRLAVTPWLTLCLFPN